MKWRILPVRFRQRILLGFSVLILLCLGVMIFVELVGIPGTSNKGDLERSRARILGDLELVSGLLSQRIKNWQRDFRYDVNGLASSPLLRQYLEDQPGQTGGKLASELASFRMCHPEIESVALLNSGDASILAADGGFASARVANDLAIGPDAFARLLVPGYRETIEINYGSDCKPRLRIIRQVFAATVPERIVSLLVAECDIEHVVSARIWAVSNLLSRDWECVMAGKGGGTVTQFRDTIKGAGQPCERVSDLTGFAPIRLAISGIEGPYDGPDHHGQPVLAFHRQIRLDQGIAMALVLKTDRALALQPAIRELWHRCLLWLFMFAVGIGLCIFLSQQISRPINELVAVARRIEAGDLTGRVAAPDASEIGQFAAVFNEMVARLELTHQELEQQVLDRTRDLRILSARQQAILTAAPDIIVEVDMRGDYTWSNRAGFGFFGDDFIGQAAASYVVGDVKPVWPPLEGAATELYVESWQRRKDGETRLLAWWSSELKDDQGRVTGVIATARDITERKQAEQALQREYAELERFNRLTLGRELRMIELKREINELLKAAGEPEKYRIVSAASASPAREEGHP